MSGPALSPVRRNRWAGALFGAPLPPLAACPAAAYPPPRADLPRQAREVPLAIVHANGTSEMCYERRIALAEGDKVIFTHLVD